MATITLRLTKGSPLTYNEIDANLTLVDFGCSNGDFINYISQYHNKIIGVEINKKQLGEWLSELITDGFWKDKLTTDIVILSNDDFKDFVNLSTEVITRTKIDNKTGTVQAGALFTEEFLPAESIMYSLVMASPVFLKEEKKKEAILQTDVDVMNYFSTALPDVIQIGGNATLGKGIVRVVKSLLTEKEVKNG